MSKNLEIKVAYNKVMERIDAIFGEMTPEKDIKYAHMIQDVTVEAALAVGFYLLYNHQAMKFKDPVTGERFVLNVMSLECEDQEEYEIVEG